MLAISITTFLLMLALALELVGLVAGGVGLVAGGVGLTERCAIGVIVGMVRPTEIPESIMHIDTNKIITHTAKYSGYPFKCSNLLK